MRFPLYYYYLAPSFIFAAVNYRLIWYYEDENRRNMGYDKHDQQQVEEMRSLFGIAPLAAEHLRGIHRENDDVMRHDDDGDLDLTSRDDKLSSDISELLFDEDGDDDFHDMADDDDYLLAYSVGNNNDNGSEATSKRKNSRHSNKNGRLQLEHDATMQEGHRLDVLDDERVSSADGKDSVYNHRPKQNRTGTVWNGWPKPKEDVYENWWRSSKMCFDVDHICHTRSTNEWFYYEPKKPSSSKKELFQPSMELRCEPLRYDRGLIAEERVNITVESSSLLKDMEYMNDRMFRYSSSSTSSTNNKQQDICRISRKPTHMVLQSMFNFMIGEFYARSLLPLHRLMTVHTPHNANSVNDKVVSSNSPPLPWEQDIQFYVHFMHGNQKLFDGHKLLLSGMLSGENSGEVLSMVDLFLLDHDDDNANANNSDDAIPITVGKKNIKEVNQEEENDITTSDCECFEKMVFCGYDVYVNESDGNNVSENISSTDADEKAAGDMPIKKSPDNNARYTLWGSSTTADDIKGTGFCGKSEIDQDLYSCEDWAELRRFLASNFMKHYPSLERDVIQFRRETLLGMNLVNGDYSGNTKEWKFVGLAQRSYRRSWINLPEVMEECNALSRRENKKRVVCVEVNVENTSSPYEQLLLHRSVDALIGVHGAQLTQAVLLPTNGHVLELLPWVTDYIRGWWVQTRHTPTPLGIIFHNSDLNHVGYSLNRDSVPLCNGVGEVGSQEEKECFLKGGNRKSFIWESRDFTVRPDVIIQYIERFLLRVDDNATDCKELAKVLDEQFVLYNVWCSMKGSDNEKVSLLDPRLTLRHFYDNSHHFHGRGKKKQKKRET